MRTLRPILLALLFALLVFSAGWAATKQKSGTSKAKAKPAAQSTTTKAVKGYTTKSGKVVQPYERKAPAKGKAMAKAAPVEKGKAIAKAAPVAKGKAMAKAAPAEKSKAVKPAPSAKAKKPAKAAPSEAKTVHVKGYTTKSGKVVQPYTRKAPSKHK